MTWEKFISSKLQARVRGRERTHRKHDHQFDNDVSSCLLQTDINMERTCRNRAPISWARWGGWENFPRCGWRALKTENWPHNYEVCIYVKHTYTSKGKTMYNCPCVYAYASAHVHSDIYVSVYVCWRDMSVSGFISKRGWREATLFANTKTISEFVILVPSHIFLSLLFST